MTNYEKIASDPEFLRRMFTDNMVRRFYHEYYLRDKCNLCQFFQTCRRSDNCTDTIPRWLKEDAGGPAAETRPAEEASNG